MDGQIRRCLKVGRQGYLGLWAIVTKYLCAHRTNVECSAEFPTLWMKRELDLQQRVQKCLSLWERFCHCWWSEHSQVKWAFKGHEWCDTALHVYNVWLLFVCVTKFLLVYSQVQLLCFILNSCLQDFALNIFFTCLQCLATVWLQLQVQNLTVGQICLLGHILAVIATDSIRKFLKMNIY